MRSLTPYYLHAVIHSSIKKTTRKMEYESECEDRNLIQCQSGKELYCVGKMLRIVTSRIAEFPIPLVNNRILFAFL